MWQQSSEGADILFKNIGQPIATFFCNVHFVSKVYHISIPDLPDVVEYYSSCRVYPSSWLAKLGLNHGFDLVASKSSQGWQHKLKVFYPVLDNLKIFLFVFFGDIEGVKALLKDGKASVWDINPREETPLHVRLSQSLLKTYPLKTSNATRLPFERAMLSFAIFF